MLYSKPSIRKSSKLSLSLHSSAQTTSENAKKKRHTIPSNQSSPVESCFAESDPLKSAQDSPMLTHWKTIEQFYVNRLDSLQKEIETAIQQNEKLSAARNELVQDILQLHKKSAELTMKNENLTKSITEKEKHAQQPPMHIRTEIRGVTLEDAPYTPPSPPEASDHIPQNVNSQASPENKSEHHLSEHQHKPSPETVKQPGLFRKISLRLSTKKRRQEDAQSPLQISDPLNAPAAIPAPASDAVVPTTSVSEPLLHPAAVVTPYFDYQGLNSTIQKRKKNVVFGNDLVQQAKLENTKIPFIILNCIREVELRGLSIEGIYRKSGTLVQIKELQDALNEQKNISLSRYQDVSVITSVLKLYFRELPTPLISNDFICPSDMQIQEKIDRTCSLLRLMPTESYCTLKYLMEHLRRIHQNHTINRMPSRNLAVIFGPTLMRFTAGNEEQQMRDMIDTIDFFILHCHVIFAEL
ncbi:Rho GTPase activation protein [Blakeslea trispora]|nr:Rho GTPase activation protein [Blakeslea trispora]